MSSRTARTFTSAALVAALALGGAACSDEDGDGANLDEEVGEIDDRVEEGTDKLEQEVDEGTDQLQEEVDQGRDAVENGG